MNATWLVHKLQRSAISQEQSVQRSDISQEQIVQRSAISQEQISSTKNSQVNIEQVYLVLVYALLEVCIHGVVKSAGSDPPRHTHPVTPPPRTAAVFSCTLISFRVRQRGKLEFKSQFINYVGVFHWRNGDAGFIVLTRLIFLANVSMIKWQRRWDMCQRAQHKRQPSNSSAPPSGYLPIQPCHCPRSTFPMSRTVTRIRKNKWLVIKHMLTYKAKWTNLLGSTAGTSHVLSLNTCAS